MESLIIILLILILLKQPHETTNSHNRGVRIIPDKGGKRPPDD